MAKVLDHELALIYKRDAGADNLMSALIRASEEVQQDKVNGESAKA